MHPQAGRPDAQPEPAKAPAKPAAPEPVKALPKPEVKPEAVKVQKPEPAKPAIQPKKPAAAPKPSPKEPTYDKTLSAIEDLRRKQEIESLKQQLAQLGSKDTRKAVVPGAPAGMVDGKGQFLL